MLDRCGGGGGGRLDKKGKGIKIKNLIDRQLPDEYHRKMEDTKGGNKW